jgi:hypothetical protein
MYRYQLDFDIIKQVQYAFIVAASQLVGQQITQANGRNVCIQFYGISPFTCSVTWYLLTTVALIDLNQRPTHLLWALYFFKNYTTEEVSRKVLGNPDYKTMREHIWYMIEKISSLGNIVVRTFVCLYYIFNNF